MLHDRWKEVSAKRIHILADGRRKILINVIFGFRSILLGSITQWVRCQNVCPPFEKSTLNLTQRLMADRADVCKKASHILVFRECADRVIQWSALPRQMSPDALVTQ